MKVVLSAVNASYTHSSLAIYALNTAISSETEVVLCEYNINQIIDYIVNDLYSQKAEIYFFSCYIWNIEYIKNIASSLKKISNAVIVFGGSEVGFTPGQFLRQYEYIDFIISGEGETLINDFIYAVSNNNDPSLLPNVYHKNKEYIGISESGFNFADRKFPYTKELIDNLSDKILYYESSRGCPYHCSYCISHIDKKMRYVPLDKVKKELQFFIDCEVKQVKFIDRTFNSDNKRAAEIVRFIIANNKHTNFHFEVCTETLSDELICLLNSAPTGFFQIETGLQSINPESLKAIDRINDLHCFQVKIAQIIKPQNIHVHADLIAGLPNETYETFQQGFNFLYSLKPHMIQLGFLKILKGTRIFNETVDYGIEYTDYPPYEVLKTESMTHYEIMQLKNIEILVDKYYNSGIFRNTLDKIISQYYSNSFDFFYDFSGFFDEGDYFKRPLSRKELYQVLYYFIEYRSFIGVKQILIFDFLKNNPFAIPDFFDEAVKFLHKEKLFKFLNDDDNIIKYLPYYEDLIRKEIVKKICIIQLNVDPISFKAESTIILFSSKKENDVFNNNTHIILKNIFDSNDFS